MHGHAEGLQEFYSTRQALRGKDLHHTNRITHDSGIIWKGSIVKRFVQQIKNDVGSFFETTHPQIQKKFKLQRQKSSI